MQTVRTSPKKSNTRKMGRKELSANIRRTRLRESVTRSGVVILKCLQCTNKKVEKGERKTRHGKSNPTPASIVSWWNFEYQLLSYRPWIWGGREAQGRERNICHRLRTHSPPLLPHTHLSYSLSSRQRTLKFCDTEPWYVLLVLSSNSVVLSGLSLP